MPTRSGQSLYLRPFLYGSESGYLLRNSVSFRFMVIANPVEPYTSGALSVAIERADVRAAVGGIGAAKASANYAGSLRASSAALARGYTVALWLDATRHRFIQELSGMNFFAVLDGELHTPELDGAILPGITRDSLVTLARQIGFKVRERPMVIDELLEQILNGSCTEIFACGTAAIVAPIAVLADGDGREYRPRETNVVASRLREALLAIQERRAPDVFSWTAEVAAAS
jgi:branched-chain amino acid aminotransferase